VGFGYGEMWHIFIFWGSWKPEGFCPRLLLSSCVLRTPEESFGAEEVVLPVLRVVALLGDQLFPIRT